MSKKYSEDLKWRIVYLWNDNYSIEQISRFFYISEKTVYKVLNNYILWKDVKDPIQRPKGRRKFFNNSDLKVCIIILLLNIVYDFRIFIFF